MKEIRRKILKDVRRAVVKVGSGVLTAERGLNFSVMQDLARQVCELADRGIEIILVSSGAIASGMAKIGLSTRPNSVSQQQAAAAVGQSSLMMAYEEAFGRYGRKVAQLLLTRDDLNHRRRYLNARNTLFTLLKWRIIPIINENDTVMVEEIKFGDNDNLSAMVTNLTEARLLVNLTNIDGFFDKDPRTHQDAGLLRIVRNVDRRLLKSASGIPGFLGTGGMLSKVKAAEKVALGGVPTVIANGLESNILIRVFEAHDVGTLFLPKEIPLCSRKHWILFTMTPKGKIAVDEGAFEALVERGKSLLPSGILSVDGRFSMGDAVLLTAAGGREIGVGLVNYHAGDVRKIMGARSSQIEGILGYKHEDEVIHRDNLVITYGMEQGEGVCHLRT
ncbi:MAG: glutamate 5-kinase [Deltaproteobacteria bacterium]|nr:MAG: glutamate 5-kinase [Deltaproteobacteria bacterium]